MNALENNISENMIENNELSKIENDAELDSKKETDDVCTIYLLTNKINGKIYIGQTWLTLSKRMGKDGCNYKNSTYLYSAILKYGSENFEYTVLNTYNNQEDANEAEAAAITEYNSLQHDIGYNLKLGGVAGRHTEETKKKISENHAKPGLGRMWTEDMRQVLRNAMTGRVLTPEHREKVIQTLQPGAFAGHHHTEEAKQAMSDKLKGVKKDPVSVAAGAEKRKMSKDRRNDIIQAYKDGMIISEIVEKFKTGTNTIYRFLNEEGIKKERPLDHLKGKTISQETKDKMSESAKELWDKRKNEGGNVSRPRSEETVAKTAATRRAKIDWAKILKEYDEGTNASALATKYNLSSTNLYRRVKEHEDLKKNKDSKD